MVWEGASEEWDKLVGAEVEVEAVVVIGPLHLSVQPSHLPNLCQSSSSKSRSSIFYAKKKNRRSQV